MSTIRGKIRKEVRPREREQVVAVFGVPELMQKLNVTSKNFDSKVDEADRLIQEVRDTGEALEKKVDGALSQFEEVATELIADIKSLERVKGDKGEDADERRVIEAVMEKVPTRDDVVSAVLERIPKPDIDAVAKSVIRMLPDNKPSLKLIQERIEVDPMSVINQILALPEGKFKLKTGHIDGLEQTISAFRHQLATGKGYLHGGGDTVVAGTNISITTNAQGQKVISATGAGTGSVTSVSVVSANGLAGTVATATTTPAITLSTTVTGILEGNGTAISAASTTGSGAVVLANTPTLITPNIGAATGTSLSVSGALQSATSLILEETGAGTDTITLQAPASITASYTLTLPVDDGASGEVLSTNGSGVLSWVAAAGSGTVTEVSVVTANGVSGSVANATTTPAITLTLGAITPSSVVSSGAIQSNTSLVLQDPGAGTETVTIQAPTLAGSYTLTLPVDDGASGEVLSTNGSGVLSWISNAAGANTALSNLAAVAINTSLLPGADDGAALGDATHNFSDLFLASGAVINFNAGDVTITHSANLLAFAGGNYTFAGTLSGTSSLTLGAAAGTTGSLLLAGTTSGTVTVKVADAAGTYTLTLPTTDGGANEFLQTDGSGVLTWAVPAGTGANTALSNLASVAINTSLISDTDNTDALGSATVGWSDLFLGSGAVIGIANGNWVATHTSGILTVGTGDLRVTTAGTNTASVVTVGGAQTLTSKVLTSATITTSLVATTDDGAALGDATHNFSDLFLASGALINFANGNAVITHSSGILTVSTGDLRVTTAGTNTASVVTVGGTQTLTAKTLTAPVINAASVSGIVTLLESTSIDLDPGLADGTWTGITRTGTAGAALAFGDLVYLAAADSRWELADADAATTADRMLGMVVLAATGDGDPTRVLLVGNIRADTAFPAMTIGSAMYVGETAGDIQVAIPTGADNVIRRVGYALTADELYFNPSMDAQTTVA